MIKRVWYALKMAWRYRQILRAYCVDPALQRTSVLELDPNAIRKQGFKAVILDFDGVLASHGEAELSPEIAGWLNNFIRVWKEETIFVLSNKPEIVRIRYFKKYYPGIKFIIPLRKKPYPDSILQVLQLTGVDARELLVLDDRLLTGVLAAVIANTQARYITHPLISFRKRPLRECFFMVLRTLERCIFRYF